MNRREFTNKLLAAGVFPMLPRLESAAEPLQSMLPNQPKGMAMLMYPEMFPLDLVGPHAVFGGHFPIHLVWKTRDPLTRR